MNKPTVRLSVDQAPPARISRAARMAAGVILLGACQATPEKPAVSQQPVARPAFELIGHRGARGLLPENTLPGFARALSLGVRVLELDVGVSKDGHVVVSHDQRLDTDLTRDKRGLWLLADGPPLITLSLDQIKSYDVGRINPRRRPYARRFASQSPVDGTTMPTLEEVIALWRRVDRSEVRLDIEIKGRPDRPDETLAPKTYVAKVVEVLRERGMLAHAAIQSFDWRTLAEVQRQAPELPTICLTARQRWIDNVQSGRPGPSSWTAGLDVDDVGGSVPQFVKRAGCGTWSTYWRELDAAQLAEAHALGLKVLVWTVNDEKQMESFVKLGVDGIISDYPDRLRKVLTHLGIAIPPQTPAPPVS